MRWSIRTKLAVIALLALVPLAVFFGFATQGLLLASLDGQMDYMRAYILLEARRAVKRNAGTLSALLADHQAAVSDEARALAALPAAQRAAAGKGEPGELGRLLQAHCSKADVLVVLDRQGRVAAGGGAGAHGLRVTGSQSLQRAVSRALAGQPVAGAEVVPLSLLRTLAPTSQSLAQARIAELSPSGEPLGSLDQALALMALEPMRAGRRVMGATLAGYVLSGNRQALAGYRRATGGAATISLGGVRITSTLPAREGHEPGTRVSPAVVREVLSGGSYLHQENGPEDGTASAWYLLPLTNSSGQVIGCLESETPLSHLLSALREMDQVRRGLARDGTHSLLLRLLFAIIVAIILSGVVANGIAAPIRALRREVQRIAEGDYEQAGKIKIETGDEIEELAADFSVMARRLREAREQERMALVGQMASSVVHDLRNPLTAIQGFAPLLADPDTSEAEKKEFLAAIELQSQRISTMISDLLEFSRGREALQRTLVCLDDFVAETAGLLATDLRMSGVEVKTELGSGAKVWIDANRMTRVLSNLAGNARDAMPQGGRLEFATSRVGKLALITVTDTGPGIPPEIREQVFEPFLTHGKANGTGLGLAICKQIVTAHGGAITLEQAAGRGARFVISLPVPEADDNQAS